MHWVFGVCAYAFMSLCLHIAVGIRTQTLGDSQAKLAYVLEGLSKEEIKWQEEHKGTEIFNSKNFSN